MRIQILMSTYNGEKFLVQQLRSLEKQNFNGDITLLIRDDGSTDSTLKKIREFNAKKLAINVVESENVGVIASFGQLVKEADSNCDLFMFCDQDDVWLPDKVAKAAENMAGFVNVTKPVLYAGRSYVVDENLRSVGETSLRGGGPSFAHAIIQTIAPGHTMMFNRALLELLRENYPVEQIVMHDAWAYLIAAALGVVRVDATARCLYRNHSANVLGYEAGFLTKTVGRFKRILRTDRGVYTRQLIAFQNCFGKSVSKTNEEVALGFIYSQSSFFRRVSYVLRHHLEHETLFTTFVANVLYVFGRYRYFG